MYLAHMGNACCYLRGLMSRRIRSLASGASIWFVISFGICVCACRKDPSPPHDPCLDLVDWVLPADRTLDLGYSHYSHDDIYLKGPAFEYLSWVTWSIHLSSDWYPAPGDPNEFYPMATVSSGDSIGLVRMQDPSACLDGWSVGDTIPVFSALDSYGRLLDGYGDGCHFVEGRSYMGFVEIIDGHKYVGYVEFQKQYIDGGRRWSIVQVRQASCPETDLVIGE